MVLIAYGVLALGLAFGVAWLNTRLAGLIWVAANFLSYQWAVEVTRDGTQYVAMAANVTVVLLIIYLSIMSLSGIWAAHMAKRVPSEGHS